MDEKELKVLVDLSKNLGAISGTLQVLQQSTANLVNIETKNAINLAILKELYAKLQQTTGEVQKTITQLSLQIDLKEVTEVKAKQTAHELKKKLASKKFDWSVVKEFFKNSKWVFLIGLGILLLVLVLLRVINFSDLWCFITKNGGQ